jgi:nucleolar protein 56
MAVYLLFESATGYALFLRREQEEIGAKLEAVQKSIDNRKRFKKLVKFVAFYPFTTAEQALNNLKAISRSEVHDDLAEFLSSNLPSVKKSKFRLAVADSSLPQALNERFPNLKCEKSDVTDELIRGLRFHFDHIVKGFDMKNLGRAQLGLAHAYSRSQVQQDVKRQDKHIIHSIALLEQLDKDINTFAMRLKEWYSWHFPELGKIVSDNIAFAKAVKVVRTKNDFDEEVVEKLGEALGDEELAKEVYQASLTSMGQEMNELDEAQINLFCDKVVKLAEFRERILNYLKGRMNEVAPNLSALIGETVGAKLLSQAGGISTLAKLPASTVQILGAEKALFRALKTRGNTPKYGILYHSSFIGKAGATNKGRISRFLANKCAMASRLDAFFPVQTNKFGERMREQVEERLRFFSTGQKGRPNEEVMHEVLEGLKEAGEMDLDSDEIILEEKPKKRKRTEEEEEEKPKKKSKKLADSDEEEEEKPKKKKKAKKVVSSDEEEEEKPKKKHKKARKVSSDEEEEEEKPKKKKKDKKKHKSK